MSWSFGSKSQKESPPIQPTNPSHSNPPPPPAAAPSSPSNSVSDDENDIFFARYGFAPTSEQQTQPQPQNPVSSRSQTRSQSTSTPNPESKPSSITPYPSEMSCRAAFDNAFYCQSLGGQFNNIWRYGEMKDCRPHWAQWSFCMGLKVYTEPARREMVREFYKKREEEKYGDEESRGKRLKELREGGELGEGGVEGVWGEGYRPSSADVWEERKVRVRRAFWKDPLREGILERRRKGSDEQER